MERWFFQVQMKYLYPWFIITLYVKKSWKEYRQYMQFVAFGDMRFTHGIITYFRDGVLINEAYIPAF